MRTTRTCTVNGLIAAFGLLTSLTASATPIVDGLTSVTLTSAPTLVGAGLSVAPLGSATVTADGALPVATFPITGGEIDNATGAALIEHDGSGLQLASGDINLLLENFLIDTGNSVLLGDVSVFDAGTDATTVVGNIALFDITASLGLNLTAGAGGAINDLFGIGDLTGAEIGVASVDPVTAAVSTGTLPIVVWLLAAGFVGRSVRRSRG